MASNCYTCYYVITIFLLTGLASSSSSISYDALGAHGGSGRALLQLTKSCNVSFQDMDYSIITSKCKGPQYPAKPCCDALKEFACPHRDALNDMTTDCATTMFSYINLYGKYPPGLFANECREGKEGLDCEQLDKDKAKASAGAHVATARSSLLILTAGLMLLLFQLF